jgi:hypothetical protein
VSDFNPKTGEFVVLTSESQRSNQLVVVTNWFEELKARFGAGQRSSTGHE